MRSSKRRRRRLRLRLHRSPTAGALVRLLARLPSRPMAGPLVERARLDARWDDRCPVLIVERMRLPSVRRGLWRASALSLM